MMIVLALLLFVSSAQATTYYVATDGADTNDGSTGSPWRNPQKCAQPPVAAGDTCIVRSGTYTAIPFVILISTSVNSASGTASSPITIKSEFGGGAKLVQPTRNAAAVAVYVARPYYIIENFDIDGDGVTYNTGTSASHAGIGIYASNVTVRHNHVHHIARALCSDSTFGNAGIFVSTGLSNILIEKNLVNTIGRRRNGESGCTPVDAISQRDHGIYITWGTDITVQYNEIYDTNRGYPLNIYSSSASVHTRYKINNNTIGGRSPTGAPSGDIIIGGIWVDGEIKNNIFFQPDADLIIQRFNLSASSTGNVISYNRTNLNLPGTDFMFGTSTPTGFTSTNNTENVALGLTDASCTQADGGCENHDFTLAAGSASIDAGTNVGLPFNGSAPDVGAFETFTFSSCEVPVSSPNTIQVTFTSNVGLLGETYTTFTARLNTVANASAGAGSKIGDTIISLPWMNSYLPGDTADISWASGGLTDNMRIGGTLNQPFVQTLTNQSCTNHSGGSGAHVFTVAAYDFRGVHGPENTTDIRSAENVATYEVVRGGAFRIRFAVVCSVVDCPPTAFYLRYSTDAVNYTLVPDTYGSGNIGLCSTHYTGIGVANGTPTTDQLSTGGTFIPGGVMLFATAIPTISGLLIGYKTELEYCVSLDDDASASYQLQLQQQGGGSVVSSVTPTITAINPMGSGF